MSYFTFNYGQWRRSVVNIGGEGRGRRPTARMGFLGRGQRAPHQLGGQGGTESSPSGEPWPQTHFGA